MTDPRLEQILTKLAMRHAPELLRQLPAGKTERIPALARRLASYNLLVLMGQVSQPVTSPDTIMRVQTWADGYIRLYSLLAHDLFPSFTHISAQYADDKLPVVIVIKGAATPIVHVLAGFVSPFIAQRQGQATVSEVELLGLMDTILEELEASDLPREEYKHLRADGMAILKDMLRAPVRQLPLTPFDRPLFSDIPVITPQQPEPLPPPITLPEAHDLPRREDVGASLRPVPTPPTEPGEEEEDELLFDTSIPIFFTRKPRETKKPRPPVPNLPGGDDDSPEG
jgi:hypothetical protein